MTIHLVTVVGGHVTVFDEMLRHYKECGVESLLVNIHLRAYDDPLYDKVRAITAKCGGEIISVFVGKWLQSVNPYLYRHTLKQMPGDWFILADSDEFQVYPESFTSVVQSASERGYDHIKGFMVDRVASDGGFPKVESNRSLWEQFPLAGLVTFPLAGGNILKVVAAKGSVRISPGQHYALGGHAYPSDRYNIPIHHFKWTFGILDRLRLRAQFYKSIGDNLWRESERILRHCEQNGGRLNVHEPAFQLRESGLSCPHDRDLKEFVASNASRMPQSRQLAAERNKQRKRNQELQPGGQPTPIADPGVMHAQNQNEKPGEEGEER